jgi:hypothetical protein
MRRFVAALLALALLATPVLAGSGTPFISGNTTNCQLVAKGPHYLVGFSLGNTGQNAWLKVFDTATAPTAGTGTPYPFPIPTNVAIAGSNVSLPQPLLLVNGFGFCVTGGAANTDATALTSTAVSGTIFWSPSQNP